MEALLTAEQVATLVGAWCGKKTVLKAARNGEIARVRLGRGYGFRERDVEAWIEARRSPATVAGGHIAATLSPRSAARRSKATA